MSALAAYERAMTGTPLVARLADGRAVRVPVERWVGAAGEADRSVLDRARGPVLDVGCGPGRHVDALTRAGVAALGIDVSEAAVRRCRARRAAALHLDVFGPVPAEGQWGSVLLLDGNVGIGGDPVRLLRRCCELLADEGLVLVETGPPGSLTGPYELELHAGGVGGTLHWATVAADAMGELAQASNLRLTTTWDCDGRWFAALRC
jgi:SAM-dependent methyltransferase